MGGTTKYTRSQNIDRLIVFLAEQAEIAQSWRELLAWLDLPADSSLQAVQNRIAFEGVGSFAVADDPSIEV